MADRGNFNQRSGQRYPPREDRHRSGVGFQRDNRRDEEGRPRFNDHRRDDRRDRDFRDRDNFGRNESRERGGGHHHRGDQDQRMNHDEGRGRGGFRGNNNWNQQNRGGFEGHGGQGNHGGHGGHGGDQPQFGGGFGCRDRPQLTQPSFINPKHQNLSLAGFYTADLKEQMPPIFSQKFRARPMLKYLPPSSTKNYTIKGYQGLNDGITDIFCRFEDEEAEKAVREAAAQKPESKGEIKKRVKKEKIIKHLTDQRQEIKTSYRPESDRSIRSDPRCTVFVARLSFHTDKRTLSRQFEQYGDIRHVKLIYDKKTDKPRGYAFIEYHDSRSAEDAVRRGNGRRIDGRHVLVDKELARVDRYWLPRRLGGGKGGESRRNKDEESTIREIRHELRAQWKAASAAKEVKTESKAELKAQAKEEAAVKSETNGAPKESPDPEQTNGHKIQKTTDTPTVPAKTTPEVPVEAPVEIPSKTKDAPMTAECPEGEDLEEGELQD